MKKVFLVVSLVVSLSACTRIETGEVGVVRGFDKQISKEEKLPGEMPQTITQTIITAQTKDISVDLKDLRPLAKDNSTVADFDVQVVYSVNPSMAAELYVDKSSSFHAFSTDGDLFLLYNYVTQVGRNAAYKAAREYESLQLSDNRQNMEEKILVLMNEALNAEKGLEGAVTVSQILIRNIQPAASITESANDFIRAQNEFKKKQVEVETAKKEAERIAALSANKEAIEYMNAQANMMIAEGVRSGKVNTVVIPNDFKGIVNLK